MYPFASSDLRLCSFCAPYFYRSTSNNFGCQKQGRQPCQFSLTVLFVIYLSLHFVANLCLRMPLLKSHFRLIILKPVVFTTFQSRKHDSMTLSDSPYEVLKWPKPSGSLDGQFKKAAIATDHGLCSEIGRFDLFYVLH